MFVTVHISFMIFSSPRLWILLFIAIAILLPSCVSKGKYYSALQKQASASSALGVIEVDLGDANERLARQEAIILALRGEIAKLGNSVEDISSQNKHDQMQLGATLNRTQAHLEEKQQRLNQVEGELSLFKAYHSKRQGRLQQVSSHMNSWISSLPLHQVSILREEGAITVKFGEGLFFVRDGSQLSAYGSDLVRKIAVSLSGQSDLLVDILAYPTVAAGPLNAWSSASERANTIGFALVSTYGLSPKQVSAAGKQGEIVVIDGAPAESKQRRTVELIVRLDPSQYPMPIVNF